MKNKFLDYGSYLGVLLILLGALYPMGLASRSIYLVAMIGAIILTVCRVMKSD
ncbi:hypothetical protein [Clostridium cylindrosporum]|uniref:Uncharacterized protein n=1 Tax=Clostridium cylindrosporum DSM 605 TaxID=1121307 RepID=A0A0J8G5K6_CLOCY|nr:hypothetical protein [Clostridium cylindrosporum]KMT22936.1 hypothetical protein CLCY_5c01750 [Clostridium cylindrosporum DSM 605]